MRVGVLSFNQSLNDTPRRFISKSAAESCVRKLTHERISKHIIRECVIKAATPSSNHARFTHPASKLHIIRKPQVPSINPPSPPTTLNLFYPVRDMSSNSARNLQQIWGCDREEWQRRIGAQ